MEFVPRLEGRMLADEEVMAQALLVSSPSYFTLGG